MARPLRVDAPGVLHHVIVRGNERRPIFRDDADREAYLTRLDRCRTRFEFHLLAYCLMTDHAHLAIRTGPIPLSKAMHSLQASYAQFFNRRHDRVGHLFQGRYKAFVVDADRYFLALLRYIHFNPVEARICARPEQHPWSSANAFRRENGPDWLDLDEAFRLIGSRPSEARRAYRSLMGESPTAPEYPETAIKGDAEFASRLLATSEISLPRVLELPIVADVVGRLLGVRPRETRARDFRAARFRAAVAYLAREEGNVSVARTAKYFGRSESAVARGVRDLESILPEDEKTRRSLKRAIRIIRRVSPVRVPDATTSAFRSSRVRNLSVPSRATGPHAKLRD